MSKLLPPALSAARRAGVRRCSRLSQRAYEGVASLPCAVVGAAPAPPRCREALMELPPGVRATETMTPDLRRDGGATAR